MLGSCYCLPWGEGGCLFGLLPAWGRLLLLLEDQVIFPSFLLSKFWNFLICLSLTLLNLVSPTLSTKPWHSLSLSVEIYWYQYGDLSCDDEYIGKTSRTFGERYKEHLKAPSAIHHHSNQTGHTTNQNKLPNNREGGAQFS